MKKFNFKKVKQTNFKTRQTRGGFTLFIALVVTSLLLAIGFSLGNIVFKQLVLSSSGKESQLAFFAADSGAECALYWDRKALDGTPVNDGSFATSSAIGVGDPVDVSCGGKPVIVNNREISVDELSATTSFSIDFSSNISGTTGYRACARVVVIKNGPYTQIDSRGYNTILDTNIGDNGGDCDLANPRTLERGLQLNY